MADISQILTKIEQGDQLAANELLPLVYDELRRLAARRLARENPGLTLDATALVNEAYLRLLPRGGNSSGKTPGWDGRGHFFAAIAEAMRRILIERARSKKRIKHGGGMNRVDLDLEAVHADLPEDDLLALDEALARLAIQEPEKAKLVQLRYFAGRSNEEAAELLGISPATAKRHWRYARAWLHREIRPGDVPEPD